MSKLSSPRLDREQLREPYFRIDIDGKKLSEDFLQYVQEVQIEQSTDPAFMPIAKITIMDSDLKWINALHLTKGRKIKVFLGHRTYYRNFIEGSIVQVQGDYPEIGVPTLVLIANHSKENLMYKMRVRQFKNVSISQLARMIFIESGAQFELYEGYTKVYPLIDQRENNFDQLKRLARWVGATFFRNESGNYYFGPKNTKSPTYDVLGYKTLGMEIKSFSPTYEEENGDNIKDFVEGYLNVIPNMRYKVDQKYQLYGLGSLFDGIYAITKTTHTINNSGFSVELTVKKTGITAPKIQAITNPPHSYSRRSQIILPIK